MNFVIAGIVVILIMLCTVAGFMLALIKKLEILESTLDVINFGVKNAISEANKIIREDVAGLTDILNKLIEIEKNFDSNIAESTGRLVDVCKEHLCAIQNRCNLTSDRVRKMEKDLDTFGEQLSVITDYIRERTVEKDPFFDPEPLCDSCKYDTEEGLANTCFNCSEKALCNYEPKNAFEQTGEV